MDPYEQLAFDFELEMRRLLFRYVPRVMARAYADTADALDIDLAFNLSNPRVREAIETQVLTTAKGTSETLLDAIRAVLAEAIEQGWGVDETAAAIRKQAGEWSTDKAETVAWTELARAYERGNNEAWRESGVVDRKEWILSFNACPVCQEYGGKVIGLDDEWAEGVAHPPAHTRCRCASAPVVAGT